MANVVTPVSHGCHVTQGQGKKDRSEGPTRSVRAVVASPGVYCISQALKLEMWPTHGAWQVTPTHARPRTYLPCTYGICSFDTPGQWTPLPHRPITKPVFTYTSITCNASSSVRPLVGAPLR
ncbi:hypothetical protein E2C01_038213 [Portunus trituberculatus]|uniref:Uncharacterized protein n=1 Tax=Portunus trituberculatus TaxID=210409 RepID=A0A5B7FGY8_PORTR|nr:hypothetical protein [Portunus trituberculatus]